MINLFNLDEFSDAYGNADREFWGWKTKDFSNATNQGGIHSLAIAYKLGLFQQKVMLLKLLDAGFTGIKNITSKKGSVVEAYPNEHSFCVTALVVFDALSALRYVRDELPAKSLQRYYSIIKPLIAFIVRYDEKHAIISNHLATAVAAIALWNDQNSDSLDRGGQLLDMIYHHQSDEGWYREYEGADPGYQTLCVHYLSVAFELTKDNKLLESLRKSFDYLKYFVHPDGSIGGMYGSRNTEVYYPGGLVSLRSLDESITLLEEKFSEGITGERHVLPDSIDAGNFIPLLNSYARAAWYFEKEDTSQKEISSKLPFQEEFIKKFQEAGVFLKATQNYYSICNYKKGGVLKVFDLKKSIFEFEYGGIFGKLSSGRKVSTQSFQEENKFDDFEISVPFVLLNEDYPTAFRFMVLRFLSLTIFRHVGLGIQFKKLIVDKLMTGKKKTKDRAHIRFDFGEDKITINEEILTEKGRLEISHPSRSRAIHMASSGYNSANVFNQAEDSEMVKINTTIRKGK